MNFKLRLIALLLVVIMCLSSCEILGVGNTSDPTVKNPSNTKPSSSTVVESTTTKPITTTTTSSNTTSSTNTTAKPNETPTFDLSQHCTSKDELVKLYTLTAEEVEAAVSSLDAMVEKAQTSNDFETVMDAYYVFEEAYYHIAQQTTISMLIYYYDTSDTTAETRYTDTNKMFNLLQSEYNEACKTMLETPYADNFFDGWSEADIESVRGYDPAIATLRDEIDALQVQYDQLSSSDSKFKEKCVDIYKQLITKSNQLAKLYGYDNYYDYATVNVYGRDYEKKDIQKFREYLIQYVVPYVGTVRNNSVVPSSWVNAKKGRVEDFINNAFDLRPQRNYLIQYLNSLEGTMGDNMRHMFDNKNCVFSYSTTSHPTAFQTYLYEDGIPFCLFGSSGNTATTVAHEIGHYYAALTNNKINNYDLCETHSQGNEALFVAYCEQHLSSDVYGVIRAHQIFSFCYPLIMSTLVDEFEQRVYTLESVENMTVADFDAIMDSVCAPYGGTVIVGGMLGYPVNDYWKMVTINNPVYYISYAVSAAAALQIFAMAELDYDAAISAYTTLVEGVTVGDGFLGALEKAGLTTPFEEETFINIKGMLTQ